MNFFFFFYTLQESFFWGSYQAHVQGQTPLLLGDLLLHFEASCSDGGFSLSSLSLSHTHTHTHTGKGHAYLDDY